MRLSGLSANYLMTHLAPYHITCSVAMARNLHMTERLFISAWLFREQTPGPWYGIRDVDWLLNTLKCDKYCRSFGILLESFFVKETYLYNKTALKFVPKSQINDKSSLDELMACRLSRDKPSLEWWMTPFIYKSLKAKSPSLHGICWWFCPWIIKSVTLNIFKLGSIDARRGERDVVPYLTHWPLGNVAVSL